MDKILDFYYGDNNSEILKFINSGSFFKYAEYSQELQDFIYNKLIPKKGKTYALVNALSAGEYYGSNRNGDYFPAEVLKKYHKTFEQFGHVYKHHVNKDPNKSFGKVIFSHYNDKMHRVELVIELDNEKAKDIIEELNSGKLPKVSMGCKVPYDVCSICGNKAKSRNEYCNHLKNEMNKVLSNGKKVYAINTEPKFFDLSIVTIPADQTASILSKIDKELKEIEKEINKEKFAFLKESSYIKASAINNTASIKKKVVGTMEPISEHALKMVNNKINSKKIEKLSSFPLNEVLSTFLALRIFPDREDFQKLALYSYGYKMEADDLEENNVVFTIDRNSEEYEFEDINCDNFNYKVADLLIDDIPDLSLTKELVISRGLMKISNFNQEQENYINQNYNPVNVVNNGQAPIKNPLLPLSVLGGLYLGYAKLFNNVDKSGFTKFVNKNPWIIPLLVGAGTIGSIAMQKSLNEKTAASSTVGKFLRNSLISVPISYVYAGSQENKVRSGQRINSVQDFVRRNPALTGVAAAFGASKASKFFKKGSLEICEFVNQLPEDHKNNLFRDINYMEVD